jgi:hypothetical protein
MTRRKFLSARGIFTVALLVVGIALSQSAVQAQRLTGSANPPSGLAGVNDSYVTGSGFAAGTITGATASFSASCGSTILATTPVILVSTVGTLRRFEFLIPASLATGSYQVSVAGTVGATPFNTAGTSCSAISVTASTTTLAACVPTSSLAVTVGTNVNAYVPSGSWGNGVSGIEEVPLEGSATAHNFATTGLVNSCAANSVTGEVVCTENNTNVDLINGTTLTTVNSGSNTFASFSGGSCQNCGVGINAANNTAVIAMGYAAVGNEAGVQVLNLSNNTFNSPFPVFNDVSEDISIDSSRNLILSPGEGGVYDLLKIGSGNALSEFSNSIGGELDSAAEDCTTGIALASDEFTDFIYITDLTQATFTAGTPGSWSAPGQFLNLSDGGYSAGTCGLSTAPGTGHLGVVTGEFGGSSYSALALPTTSGSGTPTLADYAYVSNMPNTPDGNEFSAGYDPHTVTAYTSPNNNKSYAVFADWGPATGFFSPNYLGVVDLACVLALPRNVGTHNVTAAAVSGTGAGSVSSCTRYVAIP